MLDTQPCKGVTRRVAQSLSRILVHLVFSTKKREPTVHRDVRVKQEEHHRRVTFQDELRRLLTRYNVTYDERYVWE